MANPHNPVTIVTGGGNPVTPVTSGCNPVTAVADGGNPVTLTDSGHNPVTFIGGIAQIQFSAPLTSSLIPSPAIAATYTFARADTDATVADFEPLVKDVKADQARFPGSRWVDNLVIDSTDYTLTGAGGPWEQNGTGVITDNTTFARITGITGATQANRVGLITTEIDSEVIFNRQFIISYEARALPGETGLEAKARIRSLTGTAGGVNTFITLGSDWQRYNQLAFTGADITSTGIQLDFNAGGSPSSSGLDFRNYQLEEVTDQTINLVASEYVSKNQGVDHGSNEDGVKYFTTENDNNSVNATTRVLTEATGTAIPEATLEGTSVEEARTNYSDTDDNLTGGAETIDITAGGTGNYTLSVFGTAAVTVAAGTATGSGFAQATEGNPVTFNITVVGTITLTLNSGALDSSQSGDFLKNVEKGDFPTSFIPSPTTTAATRNAESLSYPNTNILDDEGTLAITFTPNGSTAQYTGGGDRSLIGIRGVNNDLLHIDTTTGKLILSDGTNETVPTTLPALVAGTATKIAIRWSAAAGTMQIRQDAVEVSATFDGSMNKSTAMRVGYSGANRANGTYKNLTVYNGAVDDVTFTGLTA